MSHARGRARGDAHELTTNTNTHELTTNTNTHVYILRSHDYLTPPYASASQTPPPPPLAGDGDGAIARNTAVANRENVTRVPGIA